MWSSALQLSLLFVSIKSLAACGLSRVPSGAITVGGEHGKYSTIAAALKDTSSNTYFIYTGTYNERIYIERPNVAIYGETPSNLTYTGNTVTIVNNIPASVAGSDDACGTVRIGYSATGVSLYNLNIANTNTSGQAIALSVLGNKFGGYGLNVTGFQDTFLANNGYQFISHSYIQGAVDYLFGQAASIWVTKTKFFSTSSGFITASGRISNDDNYYVIDSSSITGVTGVATYLGRPWRSYARVVFQDSYLGSAVPAAGWSGWSPGVPQTEHVTFAEFNNTGPGAFGPRAAFATKLSSPVRINTVLGNDLSWIDRRYL